MRERGSFHFAISERKLLLRFSDISLSILAVYLVNLFTGFLELNNSYSTVAWIAVYAVYLLFFGTIFELYNLQKASDFFKSFKAIVITLSLTILCYLLTPFFTPELPENRIQIIYFYFSILLGITLGRLVYIKFIKAPLFKKNVILVADDTELDNICANIESADSNYKIRYIIDTSKPESSILGILDSSIHEIVVTRSAKFSSPTLYSELLKAFNTGVIIKEYNEVYEELTNKVLVSFTNEKIYKQFPFSKYNNKSLYLWVLRFFDILLSLLGLLFLIVMLPFILFLNAIANRGPLFYTQERVGKNGQTFKIFKLRSMVVDAEKYGAVWAKENDVRITKFGNFLRKSRLDEFPQFINILKGEMSVIGPRPERPVFVEQLEKEIPFYPTRHIIKPGLTGWAQVNTRYGSTVKDSLLKLQFDLFYIKHRNIFLDFKIIIKTLSTVIFFRGR